MQKQVNEKLLNRDYVLVMDQSGSMDTADTPTKQTRWAYAQESTESLARRISQWDPDGFSFIPFNQQFKTYENTTPEKVAEIFQEREPNGGTILAPVLRAQFADYLKRKAAGNTKANGEIMLVVTDGCPQDEAEVAKEIVNFTKKLDNGDGEYGIQFIQVGNDPSASKFLKKLDDDLTSQGAKYDIVDTKTMEEIGNMPLADVMIAALED